MGVVGKKSDGGSPPFSHFFLFFGGLMAFCTLFGGHLKSLGQTLIYANASSFVGLLSSPRQRASNQCFRSGSRCLSGSIKCLFNKSTGTGVLSFSLKLIFLMSFKFICNLLSLHLFQFYPRLLPNIIVTLPNLELNLTRAFFPRESFKKVFRSSFSSGVIGAQMDKIYVSPCFS